MKKKQKKQKKRKTVRKKGERRKTFIKRCPHCGFRIQGSELELFFTTICPSCWQPLPPNEGEKE